MDHGIPLRAIIIDDEQNGINTLKLLLNQFTNGVKVVAESSSAEEAIVLIENYMPEIVFLDINMPEMNGFELLERLRWRNFHLIFVTAHNEYALQALKNNAVDYILKPIDQSDLAKAIDRVKNRLTAAVNKINDYTSLLNEINQQNKNKILVNLKSGIEHINLGDIIFFESKSNYTKIYLTGSRQVLTSKTLKEFDDQLCIAGSQFMRVHKSYVINLNKIIRYLKATESIVLTDEIEIPLAKSKKEEFYAWLNI